MVTYKRASGLPLVALAEGSIVGKLDDFQFDLTTRQIYGFRVKGSGVWSKVGGVAAGSVLRIGRELAFVGREAEVEWRSGSGRHVEEGRAWASQYRGTRVMSRSGTAEGVVDDMVLSPEADRVLAILLETGRMVPLDALIATGPAAVIIESAAQLIEPPADEVEPASDWWQRQGPPAP